MIALGLVARVFADFYPNRLENKLEARTPSWMDALIIPHDIPLLRDANEESRVGNESRIEEQCRRGAKEVS